jgi:hypothetical protein
MKAELRKVKISLIEIGGSVCIDAGDIYVFIEKSRSTAGQGESRGSTLTPAGVQLMFHYLIDEKFLNRSIRHSAEMAGTTASNTHYINNRLLERGHLRIKTNGLYEFADKRKSIEEWAQAYQQKLKPKLLKGTFRFADAKKFRYWQNITLGGESHWGGEPAANLLTKYLKPSELTIYTNDPAVALMKRLKLLPDLEGNVRLYRKFWHGSIDDGSAAVPPLLVYADLISTNDSRCIETAKIIYERFLP